MHRSSNSRRQSFEQLIFYNINSFVEVFFAPANFQRLFQQIFIESQSGQPFKKCSTPRFFKCIISEVNVHCRNFRNESVSMLKHSKMNKKRNTKCPSRRPKLQLALPTFFLKRVNFNLCFTCLKWQLLFHCFHFFRQSFFYVLFLVLHTPFSTWGFF